MTLPRRGLWLGAALLLGASVLAGATWLRGPQVDVIEVRRAPLVRTLQFSARVATLSRVDVGSTVTGRVAEVRVLEGAAVRAGDVLVQLEDQEWRAALAQAQAAESQAGAHLTGLRSSARTATRAALAQAQATQRAAEAGLRGLQFIGAPWQELDLLRLARGYEAITAAAEWRGVRPTGLAAADDAATPTPAERAGR